MSSLTASKVATAMWASTGGTRTASNGMKLKAAAPPATRIVISTMDHIGPVFVADLGHALGAGITGVGAGAPVLGVVGHIDARLIADNLTP